VGQQTEQPETEKECRIPLVWKKSRNQKWVFEKNGLVKGKIRLNMPVFEAYGMTVEKNHGYCAIPVAQLDRAA